MGCSSCSTGKDGQPKGCKNNGTCGTDGCNKLTVFDWLSNMSLPNGEKPFDCVEIRFKNSRKEFFRNSENLSLSIGDIVATQATSGHDVGMVTLTGELVRVQMKKKKEDYNNPELPKIYRKASQKDIDIWQKCRDREEEIKKRAREIAIVLKLQMKISDVEFQGDGSQGYLLLHRRRACGFPPADQGYGQGFWYPNRNEANWLPTGSPTFGEE